MADNVPELNKTLGPMFTVDVSPFQVETNIPMEAMYTMEVGVQGSQMNPTGGYVRRSGHGAPSPTLGNNNDLYYDIDTFDLWQKYSTTWTLIANLQGPQGVQGPGGNSLIVGTTSLDPSEYPEDTILFNTSTGDIFKGDTVSWTLQGNIMGPSGPTGSQGIQGEQGPAGADGQDGIDGNDGATWSAGTSAPSGGNNNDLYFKSDTNDVYQNISGTWTLIANIQGATGAAGSDGANGADGAAGIDGKTVLYGAVDPTSEGNNGDFYINTSTHFIFGPKATGSWPSGTSLVGPTGAAGADGATGATGPAGAASVVTATSTTSRPVGTGSKTFSFPSAITNLGWSVGQKIRAVYDDSNWMQGVITAVSSTDVTITVEYFKGSGTYAAWNLFIANGVNPYGIVYTTASRSIGTGAKTFGIPGQFAMFDVGSRVRMQYDASNWMEGEITALSGGVYTLTVDNTLGSGTYALWGVVLTGKKGDTGAAGANGTNGTSFPAKSVNTQSGTSYTLQNSDLAGNVVLKMSNAAAITLTVNTGLTGIEPVHIIQYGAGQITVAGTATIRYATGLKSRSQYSAFSLIPIGTDEYLAVGDMSA